MKVTDFGATVKGDETKLYTLTNKNGMEIAVSDYGATLVQVIVPDKEGKPCDVVLGYDEPPVPDWSSHSPCRTRATCAGH